MALLKTLAGSNQFCSDDHRKRYQDDSNRLALDRLIQAKDRKKSRKQPATRGKSDIPEVSVSLPPESSFLMEIPGHHLPARRRPLGNTTPIWRSTGTLYPRLPELEASSIFSTSPLSILQQ